MLHILARKFPGNEVRLTWYVAKLPETEHYEDDPTEDKIPPVNPSPDGSPESQAVVTPPPLTSCPDLPLKPNPENNPPSKNRQVPFTRRKARDIKMRLTALGTIAKPEECVMFTGTLPGSTAAAMSAIASLAPTIVRRIRRWVEYHSASKYWLYTWEWQKRGALHIHYVIHEPDRDLRNRLIEGWKSKWTELLLSFGEAMKLMLFDRGDGKTWLDKLSVVQADAVALIKNPARYLSKYLSKSKYGKAVDGELFYPRQWSGCSRELLALTESLTETVRTMPMTTGTATRVIEELKHEMESTEGRTIYYTHPGELFGTAIHYSEYEDDIPELWDTIRGILFRYTAERWADSPTKTMEDGPAVSAHKQRVEEKAGNLADCPAFRPVDYWRNKYGHLGLRFDDDDECGNNKDNSNAIATSNDNAIRYGNARTEGGDSGSPEDDRPTQLLLF